MGIESHMMLISRYLPYFWLAFILPLTLSSCLVMPHREFVSEGTSGLILDRNNKPIQNAKVEYLHRGSVLLGSTASDIEGRFELGPFYQWFYLLYIGSPGVAPVPYNLRGHPSLPDAVRVSAGGSDQVFLFEHSASLEDFKESESRMLMPPKAVWVKKSKSSLLKFNPSAGSDDLPRMDFRTPQTPFR
jgi:hypothetical protein